MLAGVRTVSGNSEAAAPPKVPPPPTSRRAVGAQPYGQLIRLAPCRLLRASTALSGGSVGVVLYV